MEIRVHIPDELAAQAQARGLRPEAYAEEILARQVEMCSAEARPTRSPEEIRAWLDSLAQFSDKIPPLPETFRENGFTRIAIRWLFARVWSIPTFCCG